MSPSDEVDDLLTKAGADWRAGQPSPPEPDLSRIVPAKKARRWLVPALAAASVAAIATAALIVLPDKHQPSVAQGKQPAASTALGSIAGAKKHPLQVRVGDRVQVDGEVVAAPGKPVVYCFPVVTSLPAVVGQGPKPAKCEQGAELVLTGVDVDRLTDLSTVQGVKAGFAHLEGSWGGDKIAVDKQGPVVATPDAGPKVPCAAPPGGWKPGTSDNLVTPAVAAFVDARPNQLQELSIGRANGDGSPSVLIVGVAHGDPAQLRQLLAPVFKGNLCVTKVKLSKTEVDKLRDRVGAIPPAVLRPLSYGGSVGNHPINITLRILDDQALTALEPLGLDNLTITPIIRPVN
ncbi:hypothetical protein EV138_5222 [Kribbella voronezhensis]|uniref:Uncharacterized protein n=1 Tax=Kribbella voronezhensis TaxID=2512212 RepID=A0A4V3FKV2_9ACTN|nr:hypothetical protein [Kribbella voronezhensis]TDU91613.1 hypothetical protein EV138_5222 [Kribbella voronezhensis]